MSTRIYSSALLIVVCLCAIGILTQRRQLASLQSQQRDLSARISETSEPPTPVAAVRVEPSSHPSPELLGLRSKITQLTQRKQELESVRSENAHLRSQLAARTNSAGQPVLPPGYIRKSDAQWVGMSTPENTMQSFLWALRNHDLTHLSQLLSSKDAEQMLRTATNESQHGFWEGASAIPGMRLVNQQRAPDGSIRAQMELIPGQPLDWFRFEQISGEWKIDF